MLGKLLKYEFRAVSRMLGLIYAALLVVAMMLGLMWRANDNSLFGNSQIENGQSTAIIIFIIIYALLIVSIIVVTCYFIIERFYKNMLLGEGYLMHTLPVPTWMHVAAKTISALVYTVLSVCVLLLSVFLMLSCSGELGDYLLFQFSGLVPLLKEAGFSIALTLLGALVQILRIILLFYVSMTIGGAAKKNKMLYSVIAFFAICIVSGIIGSLLPTDLFSAFSVTTTWENESVNVSFENGALWRELLVNGIYCVIFFGASTFFLGKKLNLE